MANLMGVFICFHAHLKCVVYDEGLLWVIYREEYKAHDPGSERTHGGLREITQLCTVEFNVSLYSPRSCYISSVSSKAVSPPLH